MSTDTAAPPSRAAEGRRAPASIIDCDVHPPFPINAEAIAEWIPSAWKERLEGRTFVSPTGFVGGLKPPQEFLRRESIPPGGGMPGSDPEFARHDLLDRLGIHRAILTPFPAQLNCFVDPDEAAVVATAANLYFRERWLELDDRYRLNMLVSPLDPEKAAEEIRSFGASDGVAGVYLTLRNIWMGERYYFPIYEAAQEMGLPIIFHGNGTEGLYQGSPEYTGGLPGSYTERFVSFGQHAESHTVSLVFSGVFERFPDLKVCLLEAGWAFLPHLLWRMDSSWRALRAERPWVKKPPSEYVRDHIRYSTQPAYDPPEAEMLDQIIQMVHPDRALMFSTDYPHWDSDDPQALRRQMLRLPEQLQKRIFHGNAEDTFPRL